MNLPAVFDEIELLAANGHTTRVKKLIESLPSEARAEGAGRALYYAARDEALAFADELIEMGANASIRFPDGTTPLMYAAQWGNLALVRKLLAAGADIAARGPRGETALEKAGTPLVAAFLRKQMEKQKRQTR